jgi:hypothetical protein
MVKRRKGLDQNVEDTIVCEKGLNMNKEIVHEKIINSKNRIHIKVNW